MAARDIRGVLRPAAPASSPGLLPEEQPLTWPRWDDGELRLSVVDQDASAVDVTGWQFAWTVRMRNDAGVGAPLLSRSGAITSAASGLVAFGIDASDWEAFAERKEYRHDVVGIDAGGARHQLVPQSALVVLPAVSQPSDVPTIPVGPTPLPYPISAVISPMATGPAELHNANDKTLPAAPVSADIDTALNSGFIVPQLTANLVLPTPTNTRSGRKITVKLTQAATPFTVTWASGVGGYLFASTNGVTQEQFDALLAATPNNGVLKVGLEYDTALSRWLILGLAGPFSI